MEDQLISLETAKLAKEKGFEERTRYKYLRGALTIDDMSNKLFGEPLSDIVSAPTQSLLQRWLREKYNINCCVASNSLTYHFPMNEILEEGGTQMCGPKEMKVFGTYELALEEGLKEGLKLIS